jgi:hypothetical protein
VDAISQHKDMRNGARTRRFNGTTLTRDVPELFMGRHFRAAFLAAR